MLPRMRHLHYRPANGVKRTIAYLIDTLPIQMGLYLISMSIFGVSPIVDYTASIDAKSAALLARIFIGSGTLVIWILYCIIGELSPMQGTFGKKVMGISVRSVNNKPLTIGQAFGRNFAKILSYAPCLLGFIWAFFTYGNRAWHDSLSKTAVTERR